MPGWAAAEDEGCVAAPAAAFGAPSGCAKLFAGSQFCAALSIEALVPSVVPSLFTLKV